MMAAPVFLLWLLRAPLTPDASADLDRASPPREIAAPSPQRGCTPVACSRSLVQMEDRWFGEDKQRHFAMAFFITTFGHAAARSAGFESSGATVLGAAGSAAASLGKEVFDRRAGGRFSVRDLVWDAAGIAAGVLLVRGAR
jgi:putative lipoprotein